MRDINRNIMKIFYYLSSSFEDKGSVRGSQREAKDER